MLDSVDEYHHMAVNERQHWWYKSLHDYTLRTILRAFDHKELNILDAGCGTGGLLLFLRQHGFSGLTGFDLSEVAVSYSKGHGLDVTLLDIREMLQFYKGKQFDVIISNDTLYYLNEIQRHLFFESCADLLNHNGLVITNLPALQSFAGIHDLAVGIMHRFSHKDISRMVDERHFEIQSEIFWPFLLSPLIFGARFFQRLKLKSDFFSEIRSDVRMPVRLINNIFIAVCRFEAWAFRRKPFGSSLFLVLRKY